MASQTKPLNKLSRALESNSSIILDGALATYLETLGADISGALWSASILLDQPSLIKQTHLDYYRAGAQVAITASYQASVPGLIKNLNLSAKDAKAIIRKSVDLANEARNAYVAEQVGWVPAMTDEQGGAAETAYEESIRSKLFVAGSVGPYGTLLADGSEYRGDYCVSKEELKDFHRGRVQALVEAGVDVLACETIPQKVETEALIELLTTEFPGTEAWFAFTLRDSEHISDGTPLAEIAALFEGVEQVFALGFNCVPDHLALGALQNFAPLVKKGTLVVYPNSGEQWNAKAREWEGKKTEGSTLAQKTVEWENAGARLIGGCCRTTPDDIRTMCRALEAGSNFRS
ncbi:homocysteine S-methyltransferase [Phaeosphaeriaceae sp. PMI808]|nr:homocysteine S-methyltransferase [Phaeosphaeriaceae sp. PMI808]